MSVLIRPATVEDATALAAVNVSAMRAGYAEFADDRGAPTSVAEALAGWRAHLTGRGVGWTSLGDEGGVVVGLVTGSPDRVEELMVRPDRFGRGIGSALLAHAEAALHAHGSTSATLWVYAANGRARALYEHRGWRAERDGDPGVLGPQVQYRKALG